MNKKLTYIVVAAILFLLFSYENILDGDLGPSLIEEVIGFFLLLLGFFFGGKIVESLLLKFENRWSWGDKPIQRFGADVLTVGIASIIGSAIIIAFTWLFFETFGVPTSLEDGLQKQSQITDQGISGPDPRRAPVPMPPPNKSFDRPPPGINGRPPHLRPPLGIDNPNFLKAYKYQPELLFGSFILLVLVFLFEESALHNRRKEINRFASMQLAQDQMLSKINALKGQINPHFMFNNLNTLSGLIHEDVDRADRFIQSLSKNLRYVLEQNKEVMVSLQDEVEFIKSYIHLQEERFGHKLKIHVDIAPKDMDYQLPALTLELLIENALKHNIVSSTNPLSIRIVVENGFLVVTNSYQPKKENVISTGIGLNNLQEQLSLLGLDGANFGVEGDQYIARVPMIRLPEIKKIT